MDIRTGIRKLMLFMVALFVALSAGLIYWQVIAAQQVTANVHNGRACMSDNTPVRGRIFDRNGVLLADSQPSPYCGYIRHYYEPSLAGLIGYYAGPNYPATGIERQFDTYLTGRAGTTAVNNAVNKILHRPPVGDDLYLTIDVRIQRLVNKHFDDPINLVADQTFASNRGSVIVSNPHTGETLAMLSRPGFDPNKLVQTLQSGNLSYYNKLASDPAQPLLERPLQAKYVPGSTYKTMTLLAGLDSNKITLDQTFDRKHALGPITVGQHVVGPIGNNLEPYTLRFPVSTNYGFAHSDNIIFAQLGATTGVDTWLDYNKRMYVGQDIPFDLPVTPSSVLRAGQPLDTNLLADNAFGQGVDLMTPLQMSLIDNVVANDGQLMRPMLVQKIVDPDKTTIQNNQPQTLGDHQVSSQVTAQVRQSMYGVVRCGSGSLAEVKLSSSPWGIIGKTGTAELGGALHAHSWLITQAPYSVNNPTQTPLVTITAMKENAGEGGQSVGPMITSMYNDIFDKQYVKAEQPAPPDANFCCTAQLLQLGCPLIP